MPLFWPLTHPYLILITPKQTQAQPDGDVNTAHGSFLQLHCKIFFIAYFLCPKSSPKLTSNLCRNSLHFEEWFNSSIVSFLHRMEAKVYIFSKLAISWSCKHSKASNIMRLHVCTNNFDASEKNWIIGGTFSCLYWRADKHLTSFVKLYLFLALKLWDMTNIWTFVWRLTNCIWIPRWEKFWVNTPFLLSSLSKESKREILR